MTDTDQWTTGRLVQWIRGALRDANVDSAQSCADMLVADTLACDRLRIYTEWDRPWSEVERAALRQRVARALRHEPIQYIVGRTHFYSLEFESAPGSLIPRPSSETVVDAAIEHLRRHAGASPRIADICTGSGNIAIAVLANVPNASGIGVDISAATLTLARRNAARHGAQDRIEFIEGHLTDPLVSIRETSLDCLLANPPYVLDAEWKDLPANVRDHEPEVALRGGPDGLDFVRPLVDSGHRFLKPGGLLAIEIAVASVDEAVGLARDSGAYRDVAIRPDPDGLPRTLTAIHDG